MQCITTKDALNEEYLKQSVNKKDLDNFVNALDKMIKKGIEKNK